MVAFPAAGAVQNAANTVPDQKTIFENWLAATKQLSGAAAETELTIAAGVITPTGFQHRVDTEADAASDNLDQVALTNLPDGSEIRLVAENAARVATLRHLNGTGTPGTNGEMVLTNDENFALDHAGKWIRLRRKGSQWIEVVRSTVFGRRVGATADAAALRTLGDIQQATGSLTENSAPALTDLAPMTVGGNHRKVQLINMFNRITAATALTSIAIDDEIFIYDLSATITKKITPVELLKVINALTEDTTPDKAADYVLTYDASAGTVKKVKPNNLAASAGLIPIERKTGSAVASYDFFTGFDGTYRTHNFKGWMRPASSDVELWARCSDDGSTFEADASDYQHSTNAQDAGGTNRGNSSTGDTKIKLSSNDASLAVGNGSGDRIVFKITLTDPSTNAVHHPIFAEYAYISASGSLVAGRGGGRLIATDDILGFQLLFETGNIAAGDVTHSAEANA